MNELLTIIGGCPHDAEMRSIQRLCRRFSPRVQYVQAVSAHAPTRAVSAKEAQAGAWRLPAQMPSVKSHIVALVELVKNPRAVQHLQRAGAQHIVRVDHHDPCYPGASSLSEVSNLVLNGLRGLLIAHYDHCAERAYHWHGLTLYDERRRWLGLTRRAQQEAERYAMTELVWLTDGCAFSGSVPPNVLVWDVLLVQQQMGVLLFPTPDGARYMLGGATRRHAHCVERIVAAVARHGWEHYTARALAGFYVPPSTTPDQVFHILRELSPRQNRMNHNHDWYQAQRTDDHRLRRGLHDAVRPHPEFEAGRPARDRVRLQLPHEVYETVYYATAPETLLHAVLTAIENGARVIDLPHLAGELSSL